MAQLLAIIAIFISAAGVGITYRFAKRSDHREMKRAEDQLLKDAEDRGRKEAQRDAQIADLQERLQHRQEGGEQ